MTARGDLIARLRADYAESRSAAYGSIYGAAADQIEVDGRRNAELERERDEARAALADARESLAALMRRHSLATGHGDTHADLLRELDWQLAERATRLADAQQDAARYRWLKSSEDTRRVPWITDGLDQHGSATVIEDAVADLVIDAAMAKGLT